jgi:hypothetical protein
VGRRRENWGGSKMSSFVDEYLAQNPRAKRNLREIKNADDLLMLFHSRQPETAFDVEGLEDALPTTLYPVGQALHVMYQCDKDDPATRSATMRPADPDGVVGEWKRFIHRHESKPYVYMAGREGLRSMPPVEVRWPGVLTWLGVLGDVKVRGPGGVKVIKKRGWDLWSFPDRKKLVAFRDPRDTDGEVKDLLLWMGDKLVVDWPGIQY